MHTSTRVLKGKCSALGGIILFTAQRSNDGERTFLCPFRLKELLTQQTA